MGAPFALSTLSRVPAEVVGQFESTADLQTLARSTGTPERKFAGVLRYAEDMPKRSRKPRDLNALAASIVDQATDEATEPDVDAEPEKDPAAVALGRRGGLKGGKARAENMTAAQRTESARKAAQARWADTKPKTE